MKLEKMHVIPPEQVLIQVFSNGENKTPFKFTEAELKIKISYEMINALGLTIAKIIKFVPGGTLIFFPSYYLMD